MVTFIIIRHGYSEANKAKCFAGQSDALAEKIRWFMAQSSAERVILALPGRENPGYEELKMLAAGLGRAMEAALPREVPALVVLEQDIAKALGLQLRRELSPGRKMVCIDSIKVDQGDYVVMGRPVLGGLVIPVVVKTLLFG